MIYINDPNGELEFKKAPSGRISLKNPQVKDPDKMYSSFYGDLEGNCCYYEFTSEQQLEFINEAKVQMQELDDRQRKEIKKFIDVELRKRITDIIPTGVPVSNEEKNIFNQLKNKASNIKNLVDQLPEGEVINFDYKKDSLWK